MHVSPNRGIFWPKIAPIYQLGFWSGPTNRIHLCYHTNGLIYLLFFAATNYMKLCRTSHKNHPVLPCHILFMRMLYPNTWKNYPEFLHKEGIVGILGATYFCPVISNCFLYFLSCNFKFVLYFVSLAFWEPQLFCVASNCISKKKEMGWVSFGPAELFWFHSRALRRIPFRCTDFGVTLESTNE